METASECMICKDFDPKAEEYTYKSESPSSSDKDDDHNMREKRQAYDDSSSSDENEDTEYAREKRDTGREDDDDENNEDRRWDIKPFRHSKYTMDRYRDPRRRHRRHYKHENKSLVHLPTGDWVEIERHDEKLKSFVCGSKAILLDLSPDDLEYKLLEEQMQDTKRVHKGITFSRYNIKKIQRVLNGCLMRRYKKEQVYIKAEYGHTHQRMLFHGTKMVDAILNSGFDERHASKGMFGYGIYFAKNSSKSNQYAFGFKGKCPGHDSKNCLVCERRLLICRVTLGNIHEVNEAKPNIAHPPPSFHSLRGVATPGVLKYDEYIVYRGDQAYPDYVITYTLEP